MYPTLLTDHHQSMGSHDRESALRIAVAAFRQFARFLASEMEGRPLEVAGPAENALARIAVYATRQAEAIAIIALTYPFGGEQLAQLVRGLIETWAAASWLTAVEDDDSRRARAVSMFSKAVRQLRSKTEYDSGYGIPVSETRWEQLKILEETLASQIAALPGAPESWPSTKHICEELDRAAWYSVFRSTSDAVHVSAVAISQAVTEQSADRLHLGGESAFKRRTSLIYVAAQVMAEIVDTAVREFGFDERAWGDVKRSSWTAINFVETVED